MKRMRTKIILALALTLAGGTLAFAQYGNFRRQGNYDRQGNFGRQRDIYASAPSSNVPGAQDYDRFSQFITQRNIFNPDRYAIIPGQPTRFIPKTPRYAPTFTLVGTMSYAKGMFAFFDGNQSDLRKVLYQSDSNSIAGFTVAEITLNGVKLRSADNQQVVELKIGDMMQQEGATWQLAGAGELPSATGTAEVETPAAASPDTQADAAPSAALQGNDRLKMLMERRQQELK